MNDPIAKCRCGKTFTPMEWAELQLAHLANYRLCPCGLNVRTERPTLSFADVQQAYEKALEGE